MKTKKGQLSGVPGMVLTIASIGLALVLAGLIIGFGLNIQNEVHDTLADCSTVGASEDNISYNGSNNLCYNVSNADAPNYPPTNYEVNASENFLEGGNNISTQAPNVGLVAGAVIIIMLLIIGFGGLVAFKRR